jgi:hypothetical protein
MVNHVTRAVKQFHPIIILKGQKHSSNYLKRSNLLSKIIKRSKLLLASYPPLTILVISNMEEEFKIMLNR